jgi:tRNA G18 (ribose-2'-O)-methylase SpoU
MRKLIHAEILERRLTPEQAGAAQRHPVIGVLDNIRSLYNVGACFRTADAMLLARLVLTGYTPHPPRPEIDKTALGATSTVPWTHDASPEEALRALKAEGITLYALEITDRSTRIDRVERFVYPAAIVVGNEIGGISPGALALCDEALEIPMFGVKHSLNVAVAFGIAAWEMVRRIEATDAASA